MLTNEVKESLKGLKKEEIIKKISSGEMIAPTDKTDKQEFLRLASMPPEERDLALLPTENNTGNSSTGSDTNDPSKSVAGTGSKKAWWEEDGFENEDKALENVREIRRTNAVLQETVNNVNAKEGKRGQELKSLREKVETLAREREELLKKAEKVVQEPVKPKRPLPKDYEDGLMDERYNDDLIKYEEEFDAYSSAKINFEVNAKVGDVNTRIQQVHQEVEQKLNSSAQGGQGDPLEKIFKEDVSSFQKKFGLEMSVDAWTINQALLNQNSTDPVVKARAEQFVQGITPADKAKWGKITKALNSAYDFGGDAPVARYRSIEGALYDQGLLDDYKATTSVGLTIEQEKAARELRQKQNGGTISVPSAASAANNDSLNTGTSTQKEDEARLKTIVTNYNLALSRGKKTEFEASPEYQEYLGLRLKLYGRVPASQQRR